MSSDSVHGHTVLNYILDNGSVELIALREWAHREQGEQTRFHTCSVHGLSFDSLIQFFLERGKIVLVDNRISAFREHICAHSQNEEHTPSSDND